MNTGLSAVLCFSDHVLYPTYQLAPRLWGISALGDQAAAGAIMWVPGSIAFLVPAVILGMRALEPALPSTIRTVPRVPGSTASLPKRRGISCARRFSDRFFGIATFGAAFRAAMLLLAAAVAIDGFFGPQVAPMNLAGVLPVDPLARAGCDCAADGRQSFLHGVSIHASARSRSKVRAAALSLAETIAF